MKKNNIPTNTVETVKKASKPARIFVEGETKTYSSQQERKKEAKLRASALRKKRLIKAGMTEEQIREMEKDEKVRTVMCLIYGSHTVENGTRSITKRIRDKSRKIIKTEKIEVPNILRGVDAVLFTLKQNNIETLGSGTHFVWVNTTVDKLEEVKAIMSPLGRLYIQKWHAKQSTDEKKKLPSNNTAEKKKKAKEARKNKNRLAFKNRRAKQKSKAIAKKQHSRSDNLSTKEKRKLIRTKTIGKRLLKLEQMKKSQKAKETTNSHKSKPTKPVQTKLNLAA